MPKDTFYNLREDKKKRIIDICLEEFANNEYAIVSISKIVKRAEIAKGSFYQYFDNKLDLYRYIISYISDKKRGYLVSNYEGDGDFYDELKNSIIMGAKFKLKTAYL